jgi:flagellar hook-basal body complex protein FliE
MVNGIGGSGGGGLAREAIKAALDRQAEATQRLKDAATHLAPGSQATDTRSEFNTKLAEGLKEVNRQVEMGDGIVDDILAGKVTEFHEVAARIKQADLTFKFALSVRNKFIDAYREVMRMNV